MSPDEATVLPFVRSFNEVLKIAARYDLAVSGDALTFLENIGMAAQVIPLCQVGGPGGGSGRGVNIPRMIHMKVKVTTKEIGCYSVH